MGWGATRIPTLLLLLPRSLPAYSGLLSSLLWQRSFKFHYQSKLKKFKNRSSPFTQYGPRHRSCQSLLPSKLLKLVLSRLVIQKRLLNRVSKEHSLPNVFWSPRKWNRRLSRSRTDRDHRERSPQPLKVAGAGFFPGSFFPTSAAKALLDRGGEREKVLFLTRLARVTATLCAINTTPNLYRIHLSAKLHCVFLHLCWGT